MCDFSENNIRCDKKKCYGNFCKKHKRNHLISDLLPKQKDGYKYSNSDPITGQASWYDLKVSITKCTPKEIEDKKIYPDFPIIKNTSHQNLNLINHGTQFKKTYSEKKTNIHYDFIGNYERYKDLK